MKRSFRSLLAATGVAALAVAAVAASPTSDGATVTVDGSTVAVVGTLAEDLGTILIGTDAPDDAVGSGLGFDLAEYSVSFPESGTVAMHVTLGDANPATGYFPQGFAVEITPTIGTDALELTATATLDGGLVFAAQTCAVNADTGVNECSSSPIDGSYADGVLTWNVSTSALPDAAINGGVAHSNYSVSTGATGGVTFVNGLLDDMGIIDFAAIPSASLLLDGESVATSRLSNDGYALSADAAPGTYAASVVLCGGDADFTPAPEDCTTVDLGDITVG